MIYIILKNKPYLEKEVDVYDLFVNDVNVLVEDPLEKSGLFILKILNVKGSATQEDIQNILCLSPKMSKFLLDHMEKGEYILKKTNEIYEITEKGRKALENDLVSFFDIQDFEALITTQPLHFLPPNIHHKIRRVRKTTKSNTQKTSFSTLMKNKEAYQIPNKWQNKTNASKEEEKSFGKIKLRADFEFDDEVAYKISFWRNCILQKKHPEFDSLVKDLPKFKKLPDLVCSHLKGYYGLNSLQMNDITINKCDLARLDLNPNISNQIIEFFTNQVYKGMNYVEDFLNDEQKIELHIPITDSDWILHLDLEINIEDKNLLRNWIKNLFFLFIEETKPIKNLNKLWKIFLKNHQYLWGTNVDDLSNKTFNWEDYKYLKSSKLFFTANLLSLFLDFKDSLELLAKKESKPIKIEIIKTDSKNREIYEAYKKSIQNAKEKIYLVNFLLEEDEIIDLLIEKFNSGVRVYIITSLEKNLEKYSKWYDSRNKDSTKRFRFLNQLSNAGLIIRGHNKVHAKFCIIDDQSFIISSANINPNSLKYNAELGVLVEQGDKLARELSDCFIYLYDRIANQIFTLNQTEIPTIRPFNLFPKLVRELNYSNKNNGFIWTIDVNENKITKRDNRIPTYNSILGLIKGSKKSIEIFTYSFEIFNNKGEISKLWEEISEKLKNPNIKIKIILRKSKFKFLKKNLEKLDIKSENLEIYAHPNLHAKGIIIDGERCIFGSSNFLEDFGLSNNIEMNWILEKASNNTQFERIISFFENLKSNSKIK